MRNYLRLMNRLPTVLQNYQHWRPNKRKYDSNGRKNEKCGKLTIGRKLFSQMKQQFNSFQTIWQHLCDVERKRQSDSVIQSLINNSRRSFFWGYIQATGAGRGVAMIEHWTVGNISKSWMSIFFHTVMMKSFVSSKIMRHHTRLSMSSTHLRMLILM